MKRFWSKAVTGSASECWPWIACRDKSGYGQICMILPSGSKETLRSHRVAFCICRGYPLDYLTTKCLVRHTCDNPSCVNPSHLELGSHQDNMNDMVRRGRTRSIRGSKNYSAKLTEPEVLQILRQLREGRRQQLIARDFGVSGQTVWEINAGRSWSHVARGETSCSQ